MAKRRGHGEGSIYQRASDGKWVAVVNLGWEGGKRRRRYVYGDSQAVVREELTRIIRDRDRGLAVPTGRLTVAQYLDKWLAEVVEGRTARSTWHSYEIHVRRHIVPVIGSRPLAKLAPQDVNAMLRDRERAGLSPRTVRQTLVILRMALNQAVRWDLVPRNVAELVAAPKSRPYDAIALDAAQIGRFLAAARGTRLVALFTLAVLLGPRRSELLGLRWQDVDLDAGLMHIRHGLRRVDGETRLVEPKTPASKRTVPLPAICVAELREHRTRQLEERLIAGGRWQDSGFVFCSTIGTPLGDHVLTSSVHAVLAAAGLPRLRPHDLRHTAITAMIRQGIPPHVVARIVGHSSIAMTLGTYAKVVGTTMRDAVDVIDAAYGPPSAADKASS